MAKFRQGNLVLTETQKIIQGSETVLDSTGAASLLSLQFSGGGANIYEFSIDGTLAGDSDTVVPTEKAVKTYVDTALLGNIDHNSLINLQGGDSTAGEFYHLTEQIYNSLYTGSPLVGFGTQGADSIEVDSGTNQITLNVGGVKRVTTTTTGSGIEVWNSAGSRYLEIQNLNGSARIANKEHNFDFRLQTYYSGAYRTFITGEPTRGATLHAADGYRVAQTINGTWKGLAIGHIATGSVSPDGGFIARFGSGTTGHMVFGNNIPESETELLGKDSTGDYVSMITASPSKVILYHRDSPKLWTRQGGIQLGFHVPLGVAVNEFSSDETLSGNSDKAIPTEKAVKTYIDSKIAGDIQDGTAGRIAYYVDEDSIGASDVEIGTESAYIKYNTPGENFYIRGVNLSGQERTFFTLDPDVYSYIWSPAANFPVIRISGNGMRFGSSSSYYGKLYQDGGNVVVGSTNPSASSGLRVSVHGGGAGGDKTAAYFAYNSVSFSYQNYLLMRMHVTPTSLINFGYPNVRGWQWWGDQAPQGETENYYQMFDGTAIVFYLQGSDTGTGDMAFVGKNSIGNTSYSMRLIPHDSARLFHDGVRSLSTAESDGAYGLELHLGGVMILTGSGTPENNVSAPVGSLFLRDDGAAGTSMYVKETGVGDTGWIGK